MNTPSLSIPTKRHLILCIDDADFALRARKLLLGYEGYDVLTASSGEEGLELLRQYPIELVVSDHFLSGKSGVEIAEEMQGVKPEVPILIVSAASEKPHDLQVVDEFLAKAEPPEVLFGAISQLLAKKR